MSEYVFALFDFHPTEDDELPLRAGEQVEVLDRNLQFGDGWWHGRNRDGMTGIFPANHTSPFATDVVLRQRPRVQITAPAPCRSPSPSYSCSSPTSSTCRSPSCASSLYSPSSPSHAPTPLPLSYPLSASPSPAPKAFPTPVSAWSTAQVLSFLSSIPQLDSATVALFAQHDITGDLLLELDTRVLKEEMGILSWGKRVRITRAVQDLKNVEGHPKASLSPVDGTELPPYTQ